MKKVFVRVVSKDGKVMFVNVAHIVVIGSIVEGGKHFAQLNFHIAAV